MRYIRLYRNININNGRHPYHFFRDFKMFLKSMESNLVINIENNNYLIDQNLVLRLRMSGQRLIADECTYLIESDDAFDDYYRCYFIRSYRDVSGNQEFQLERDLWGTYIHRCTMSDIVVTRSNVNVGNGIFDDVENITIKNFFEDSWVKTIGGEEHNIVGEGYIPLNKLAICFVANVVTSQKLVNPSEFVSGTYVFGQTVDKLVEAYPPPTTGNDVPESPVELAMRVVSGINGISAGALSKLGVSVVKVFFMPTEYFAFDRWGLEFHTSTPFSLKPEEGEKFVFKALRFGVYQKIVPLPRADLDINKKWYIGTRFDGMPVERSTVDEIATIRVKIGADGATVEAIQGDRVKDLSQAFEVGIIGSSNVPDALQKIAFIAQTFQRILGDIQAVSKASAKGEGGAELADTLLGYTKVLGERAKGSGGATSTDGAVTFDCGRHEFQGKLYAFNPFYFRYYSSSIDEERKALITGASFNVVISSLKKLESVDFIVPLKVIGTLPFVVADAKVGDVPTEARDAIANALKGGIYLVFD